jgi:hypothetical protein
VDALGGFGVEEQDLQVEETLAEGEEDGAFELCKAILEHL